MAKRDLKKEFAEFYRASPKTCSVVDVPEFSFLTIDGSGDPNTSTAFQEAVETLYAVSYSMKFLSKSEGTDYTVMPLEGLWWVENMEEFSLENKAAWDWTVMIMQPDHLEMTHVSAALEQTRSKHPPALDRLGFHRFREGLAVQILHIGPYADEAPTIAGLHAFAEENGYALRDRHHEIYLGDPRRAAPENLRTILRQPVHPVEPLPR